MRWAALTAPRARKDAGMPTTATPLNVISISMIAGTLLPSHRLSVILRLKPNSKIAQPIFYLRFWHDLYESWRALARAVTNPSTSDPYCSSLRAPIPGIATSAASSTGSDSAMAIRVLSVNTT